jgi:hypothetical protein
MHNIIFFTNHFIKLSAILKLTNIQTEANCNNDAYNIVYNKSDKSVVIYD